MLARVLHLHPKAHSRLVRLSKEAEREGAYRVSDATFHLSLSIRISHTARHGHRAVVR